MTPVRVAHLISHPVEYYVPLYRELASRPEVELTVYYSSAASAGEFYDPEFKRVVEHGIPLLEGYDYRLLPSARGAGLHTRFLRWPNWDIVWQVIRERYDVIWIHGYANSTSLLAVVCTLPLGTRLLLREAQNLIQPRPWHKRLAKRLTLPILFRFAVGAYVGEPARAYLRHYGMPERRLYEALHCVDNGFFQRHRDELRRRRREVRLSLGISDDAPVIVFVGKLTPGKQPLELVRAFAKVRRARPCWLLLVGDGELRGEIESLVKREQIPDVRLAGFMNQAQIPSAYTAADVFVLPSRADVWGMVVNEALNFGLPVVLSDKVGAAYDLALAAGNGLVFPADDVQALARSLEQLVRDAALREQMGARSLVVAERHGPRRSADGLVAAVLAASRGRLPVTADLAEEGVQGC